MKIRVCITPKDRYKITHNGKIIPGDWNDYATYTGAAAGARGFRRNGPPARSGPHITPLEVKALRRVR